MKTYFRQILSKRLIGCMILLLLCSGMIPDCAGESAAWQIPSNETSYDQSFDMGLVSKQWEFLEHDWHIRIGSEAVKPIGLRQTFEESGEGHVSFVAEEGYWLETFDGSSWSLLKDPMELSFAEGRAICAAWDQMDSIDIDWSEAYGALPEGNYRLGRYYTVTMEDGRTETKPCYCKFQIRNQQMDVLLQECEQGIAQLLRSDDYYIKIWQYLRNKEFQGRIDADSHELVEEIWRSGDNYYDEITYYYKSDGKVKAVRGTLLRDGKGYTMENGTFTPMEGIRGEDLTAWAYYMGQFHPTDKTEVWKDQIGIIHVKESGDFYEGIVAEERRYSFTEAGLLVGYQRVYIDEAGETFVDFELERYRTAEGETLQKINSVMRSS